MNDSFSFPESLPKDSPGISPERKEVILKDTPEKAALKIQLAQYQAELNKFKNGSPNGTHIDVDL